MIGFVRELVDRTPRGILVVFAAVHAFAFVVNLVLAVVDLARGDTGEVVEDILVAVFSGMIAAVFVAHLDDRKEARP